jgi:hypothetical protein
MGQQTERGRRKWNFLIGCGVYNRKFRPITGLEPLHSSKKMSMVAHAPKHGEPLTLCLLLRPYIAHSNTEYAQTRFIYQNEQNYTHMLQ